MNFLHRERAALDALLPGLDQALTRYPLEELETSPSPAMAEFRAAGGPALLVPEVNGGLGATALEAVRVQRAVGARAPSLAVATTMHHFSIAGLAATAPYGTGAEALLLAAIAKDRLLVASGFAEGRPGQNILAPHITAERRGDRIVLNGSKMPCSLSRSMDLLTASIALPDADGVERLAIALIPAASPGLRVRPFWGTPILAGAESDEVLLTDVEVDPQLVVATEVTASAVPDTLNTTGFLWFEVLLTAGYLGVASALAERALTRPGAAAEDPTPFLVPLDAAMLAVEAVARALDQRPPDAPPHGTAPGGTAALVPAAASVSAASAASVPASASTGVPPQHGNALHTAVVGAGTALQAAAGTAPETDEALLVQALTARYAAQDAIVAATTASVQALGGMAFIRSPDTSYLASAAGALAFHPPARHRMAQPLREWLDGHPLRIG